MAVTKVTKDLLQSNSIDGDQIVDGAITSVKIANGTITQNKLGTDVIKDIVSLDDRITVLKNTGGIYQIKYNLSFIRGVIHIQNLANSPYFTPENNCVDIFPPSGKTTQDLIGIIPKLHYIHIGPVGIYLNNDDSIRCRWEYHNGLSICQKSDSDRIRLWLQQSINDSFTNMDVRPYVEYFAVWK